MLYKHMSFHNHKHCLCHAGNTGCWCFGGVRQMFVFFAGSVKIKLYHHILCFILR